jgi:plasmid stabilization system protein ParE
VNDYLIAPTARGDLDEIWEYYAVDLQNPDAADRIRDELFAAFGDLRPRLEGTARPRNVTEQKQCKVVAAMRLVVVLLAYDTIDHHRQIPDDDSAGGESGAQAQATATGFIRTPA